MTAPVVARALSKRFARGTRHDSLRDLVPAWLRGRGAAPAPLEEFWAVRDVSFEVERGRALGIIGPNGAGKSTMLKLLNRILRPTSGSLRITGRSAALIEVSAGFHPDLTGRENVFLQGAMLGLRRREVAARLDSIVDFSGIADFVDLPVKRLSSGMSARLGFSIAAHLDPDVLLVDEVLAVGDLAFQAKCIRRMHDFKREGTAIVFISHDLGAVEQLCDEAIYLRGTVQARGAVRDVIGRYAAAAGGVATATTGDVVITDVALARDDGGDAAEVSPGTPLRLDVALDVVRPSPDVELSLGVTLHRSYDGLLVYDGAFGGRECGIDFAHPGPAHVRFALHPHVTRGLYHLGVHVYDPAVRGVVARVEHAATIAVGEARSYAGIADLGIVPLTSS